MSNFWRKPLLFVTVATAAVALSNPASAALYTYDAYISNGIGNAQITVDSVAGTARYSGANIDLTVTSNSLVGFNGTNRRSTRYRASGISGTFTRYGRTYNAYASTTPKYTQIALRNGRNFLWTYGRDNRGRRYDFDGKGSLRHTGSTGGSTGGTPVPEPGVIGLFGLSLAGLWLGLRRRKTIKPQAA